MQGKYHNGKEADVSMERCMLKLRQYLKNELKGWKLLDIGWIFMATLVILGLSIYWKDSWVGILSAVTGVWCVVLTGMGKRSSFIFGMINVMAYIFISYHAKYYGEVMLNLFYYVPMNFVGWFAWKKHMNTETGEVKKRSLSRKKSMVMYSLTAVGIVVYGFILRILGGNLPFIDSMSTIVAVSAQILSVQRLKEQWILWIAVDVVSVVLWAIHFAQGNENISMLLMWSIYLINAILMYVRWDLEAKKN